MIKLNVNAIDFKTIINKHTKYVEDTGLKSFKEIYQNPSYTLGKKTFSVSNDDNSFLENLFGKTDDEVKLKLKDYCTNSNLETIISTFNKIYTQTYGQNFEADIHESAKKQKQNTSLQAVINILQKILNYNSFNDATTWNRHDFIHSLNLKVCPYCNRNYITSYKGKKK